MPNTSSIFVYSPSLLFSHRIDEKGTNIKHIAVGRHSGTHTPSQTAHCALKLTTVTFQMQMEQRLPSAAKMSTSFCSGSASEKTQAVSRLAFASFHNLLLKVLTLFDPVKVINCHIRVNMRVCGSAR